MICGYPGPSLLCHGLGHETRLDMFVETGLLTHRPGQDVGGLSLGVSALGDSGSARRRRD